MSPENLITPKYFENKFRDRKILSLPKNRKTSSMDNLKLKNMFKGSFFKNSNANTKKDDECEIYIKDISKDLSKKNTRKETPEQFSTVDGRRTKNESALNMNDNKISNIETLL